MAKLAEAFVDIIGRTEPLIRALRQGKKVLSASVSAMSAKIGELGKSFGRAGRSFSLRVTAPIVAGLGLAAKRFATFESAMRKVNTIARESEEQFKKTSEEVLKMAEELGKSPTDLANALFDINSAGLKGAEGLMVLREATKAAIAGGIEVQVAAEGMVKIMAAWGKTAKDAADVSDAMFAIVEKGIIQFKDLAIGMGVATGTAAAAKITMGELGAAIATVSKVEQPRRAFTALRAAITEMVKSGTKLDKFFKEATGSSGEMLLKTKGLGFVMDLLKKKTKGSLGAITNLGFSTRASAAMALILGERYKEFVKNLSLVGDVSKRAGAATNAYNEMNKSLSRQFEKMKAQLSVMAIKLGKEMVPALKSLISAAKRGFKWFASLSSETKKWTLAIAGLTAAIGPLLIGLGLLLSSLGAIGKALVFIAANPVVIAVAAAVASIAILINELNNLRSEFRGSIEDVKEFNRALGKAVGPAKALELVNTRIEKLNEQLKGLREEAEGGFLESIRRTGGGGILGLFGAGGKGSQAREAEVFIDIVKRQILNLKVRRQELEKQKKFDLRLKNAKDLMEQEKKLKEAIIGVAKEQKKANLEAQKGRVGFLSLAEVFKRAQVAAVKARFETPQQAMAAKRADEQVAALRKQLLVTQEQLIELRGIKENTQNAGAMP